MSARVALRWMKLVNYDSQAAILRDLLVDQPDLKPALGDPATEARVRATLTRLDGAYRRLYPQLMQRKASPDFVLVDSDQVLDLMTMNAYAPPGATEYRGYVIVPAGLFKSAPSPAVVLLMAHELAHLYLRHTKIDQTVLRMWRVDHPETQITDEEAMNLGLYLDWAKIGSSYANAEFAGMPFDESLLAKAMMSDVSEMSDAHKDAKCVQDLSDEYKDGPERAFQSTFSYYAWAPVFSSLAQSQATQATIENFQKKLVACSRSLGYQGHALRDTRFPAGNGMYVDSARYISFSTQAPFTWTTQNEFETLFDLGRHVHQDMRQVWQASRLDQIRWRSFEDEADEFAISIGRSLGLNLEAMPATLLQIFEPLAPGFTARCYQAIARGEQIPFGFLSDPHHATCYRVSILEKLIHDPQFQARP